MSSKLLVAEPPLLVQPSLACVLGLNEAIFLQQVHYWLNPKFNKNFIDNRYWVHNTLSQWRKQFPFWEEKTLRRTIQSLEDAGVLMTRLNTIRNVKTKYYTIDYTGLMQQIEQQFSKNFIGHSDHMLAVKYADDMDSLDEDFSLHKASHYLAERDCAAPFSGAEERGKNVYIGELLSLWNRMVVPKVQSSKIWINEKRLNHLRMIFNDHFENDIDQWFLYCEKIIASPYLMGGNDQGFKVSFEWAIEPENIIKILEGCLSVHSKEKKKEESLDEFLESIDPQWCLVCEDLIDHFGKLIFESWFKGIQLDGLTDNTARLVVPSVFIKDYIKQHYEEMLLLALKEGYPHVCFIEYLVEGE